MSSEHIDSYATLDALLANCDPNPELVVFQIEHFADRRRCFVHMTTEAMWDRFWPHRAELCVHEVCHTASQPCYLVVDIDGLAASDTSDTCRLEAIMSALIQECARVFDATPGGKLYSSSTPGHYHIRIDQRLPNSHLAALIAIASIDNIAQKELRKLCVYDLHTFASKSNLCVYGFGKENAAQHKRLLATYAHGKLRAHKDATCCANACKQSLVHVTDSTQLQSCVDWTSCLTRAKLVRDRLNSKPIQTLIRRCSAALTESTRVVHQATRHASVVRRTAPSANAHSTARQQLALALRDYCSAALSKLVGKPVQCHPRLSCRDALMSSSDIPWHEFVPFQSIVVLRTDCATCPWKDYADHSSNRLILDVHTSSTLCPVHVKCMSHSHTKPCTPVQMLLTIAQRKQLYKLQLACFCN